MEEGRKNPFRAGEGRLPPCLAGREREQGILVNMLAELAGRESPERNVVLIGPRSNGKTTLLRWTEQQAEARKIDVVWRTPDKLKTPDDLATALIPPRRWRKALPEELTLGVPVAGVKWNLGGDAQTFEDLLMARCGKRPLVMLLDEAHTLEPGVACNLLNTAQVVGSRQAFLLVCAGTPRLEQTLKDADATFWDKCKTLGVGLLRRDDARRALAEPFERAGMAFEARTLEKAVRSAHGYPIFVQQLGSALWDEAANRAASAVDEEVLQVAARAFDMEKAIFYTRRTEELRHEGLLPAAEAVAKRFSQTSRNVLAYEELEDATGDPEAIARLEYLGYVWRRPGSMNRTPGVPSLMNFVHVHARNRERRPSGR